MSNNSQVFVVQIKQDLLAKFKQNAGGYSDKIDQIQQQVIEDFEAVDSGLMQLKTFTQFFTNFSSNTIAKATFQTRGVDYAKCVIDGSKYQRMKRYGDRNYLEEARKQVADLITTDKYTRVFKKGSPNKGGRKVNARKF